MTHTWTPLEGESLAGEYRLQRWLGGDERGAFFLASFGSEDQQVLAKLVPVARADVQKQLALWRRTIHLDHPNLLRFYESGRTAIAGEEFLYALFEQPDERLSSALEERPLNESEVREVLAPSIDALRYLHAQGLVHGSLDPEHIVAVGDRIKLAADTLRESGDGGASHVRDIADLGGLLYELLTRRRIAAGQPVEWSGIEDPLRTIIQHATDPDPLNRWTLAEIDATLKSSPQAPPPVAVVPEPPPVVSDPAPVVSEPASVVSEPAPVLSEPASVASEPSPVVPVDHAEPVGLPAPKVSSAFSRRPAPALERMPIVPARKSVPRWIYFGVGALLLLIIGLNIRWSSSAGSPPTRVPPPQPAPVAQPDTPAVRQPPPSPVKVVPRSVTKVPEPRARVAKAPEPPKRVAKTPEPQGRAMWRLIAYTYAARTQAENKARSINEKWPDLHAYVFLPAGGRGLYLVALGGRMTHEDALRLQREARGKGLPRDIYVQNYQE